MGDSDQVKSYLIRGGSFALRFIANFAKALRLDQLAAIAYICRGLAYDQKGDYDQVIADYDQALDLAEAYNNRGLAYHLAVPLLALLLFLGLIVLAVAYNNRGLTLFLFAILFTILFWPTLGLAIAYNNRGRAYHLAYVLPLIGLAYLVSGAMAVVVLLWSAVVYYISRFKGLAAVAYNNRGFAYDNRYDNWGDEEDYNRAIADYTKALQLNSKYATVYNNRGFAYVAKGNYDQAITDYTKALQLDQKYAVVYYIFRFRFKGLAVAYNNRGFAYDNRGGEGDYDQAIADYTKAIRLDPEHAVAYNNRGFAYRNRGFAYVAKGDCDQAKADHKQALCDWKKTIQLRSHAHAISYLNMGGLYHDLGDDTQAIENYDNTVRLCPDYEADFMDRKFAYGGQGAVERAIELLDGRIRAAAGMASIGGRVKDAVDDDEVVNRMENSNHPESATYFYYLGVESLFNNDLLTAQRCFKWAKYKDYDDGADGTKLTKHLENLN